MLLTGYTGFLGTAVAHRIVDDKCYRLTAVVRREIENPTPGVSPVVVGELGANIDWTLALGDIDIVIHTAARVHVMNDSVNDPLAEFRKVNTEGTLNLARQAASKGIKRFIFISSIKVNGESTLHGKPFTADDEPGPEDPYSISKWETEIGLRRLAEETDMEVVVIRPPLVYGPGVKGNFMSLVRWVNAGLPLPLGSAQNKRSMVALDNLVDLIITCVEHPAAANQTFLVGDGEDLSIVELLQQMGKALGKNPRLLPFPVGLLNLAASLLGKKDVAQRLLGSLQVDISKTQTQLGWEPPISVGEGLNRVAEAFTKS